MPHRCQNIFFLVGILWKVDMLHLPSDAKTVTVAIFQDLVSMLRRPRGPDVDNLASNANDEGHR